jgi:hypothetical protein
LCTYCPWEANSCSVSQEMEPEGHYIVHRSPTLQPLLISNNSFHIFTTHLFIIHFNNLPSTPRSFTRSCPIRFTDKNVQCISHLQACYMLHPSHYPWFDYPRNNGTSVHPFSLLRPFQSVLPKLRSSWRFVTCFIFTVNGVQPMYKTWDKPPLLSYPRLLTQYILEASLCSLCLVTCFSLISCTTRFLQECSYYKHKHKWIEWFVDHNAGVLQLPRTCSVELNGRMIARK